jgi:hypothetical protein
MFRAAVSSTAGATEILVKLRRDLLMRFLARLIEADKTKFLEFTYIVTIVLLLSAVILTPFIIRGHFLLVKKYVIQEDILEAVLIIVLLLIAYLLSAVYKNDLKKYRRQSRRLSVDNSDLMSKLIDAFKYIGGINVQIQEIRSILCGVRRYPAAENEFRRDLALFARKLLAIVNSDWVVIRIIDQTNLRTIREHLESRKKGNFYIKGISNRAIVAKQTIDGYSIVASQVDNSTIRVVSVFPKKSLDEKEKVLVEAITHQIEMLYLIFISYQTNNAT